MPKAIQSADGSAEAAEVDALDEKAVDNHLQSVIDKAGRVDISFNAIDVPPEKFIGALIEIDVEACFRLQLTVSTQPLVVVG